MKEKRKEERKEERKEGRKEEGKKEGSYRDRMNEGASSAARCRREVGEGR